MLGPHGDALAAVDLRLPKGYGDEIGDVLCVRSLNAKWVVQPLLLVRLAAAARWRACKK